MSTFNEGFKSPHIAPEFGEDGTTDDFYERLAEQMGEAESHNVESESTDTVDCVRRIFVWTLPKRLGKRATTTIAYRVLAALWVINPALLDGKSISQIAREMGIAPSTLANFTGEFSRQFGILNRGQAHNPHLKRKATDGNPK
jgi:hypothetical protein